MLQGPLPWPGNRDLDPRAAAVLVARAPTIQRSPPPEPRGQMVHIGPVGAPTGGRPVTGTANVTRRFLAFGVGLVLVAGLAVGRCGTPRVRSGAEYLGLVSFPTRWTGSSQNVRAVTPRYQVRELRGRSDEFLVGLESLDFVDGSPDRVGFANQFYSIDARAGFKLRAASREEWMSARPLPKSDRDIRYSHKASFDAVAFQGHEFESSGSEGRSFLLSEESRWIAAIGIRRHFHLPRVNLIPILNFLGGGEPPDVLMYLDIYDVASGRKMASARGDSDLTLEAFWAGDRYFVLPLDLDYQTCFIARMPDTEKRPSP